MADGRHFKNRYIILSQQPFDWFLLNMARWCMLVPTAWREFQIFNFRQSYTADRRYHLFNDFCGFWSVAVNTMDKLQFLY